MENFVLVPPSMIPHMENGSLDSEA